MSDDPDPLRTHQRRLLIHEAHEGVAQGLAAMSLHVDASAPGPVTGGPGPDLGVLSHLCRTAGSDLRLLARLLLQEPGLGAAAPGPEGLAAPVPPQEAVRLAADRLAAAGWEVDLEMTADVEDLPLTARATLSRVVGWAVVSLLAHGGPGAACLHLGRTGDGAVVDVSGPPAWAESLSADRALGVLVTRVHLVGGTVRLPSSGDDARLLRLVVPAC